MSDKTRIVDKILKLFSLGNMDSNEHRHETMAAVTKARQLMMEHAISEADLEAAGSDKAKKVAWVIQEQKAYTLRQPFAGYDEFIALAVEYITDTKGLVYSIPRVWYSRSFIGTDVDVAVASKLFLVLLESMRRDARRTYGSKWTSRHKDYCLGYSREVATRARDAKLEHATEAQTQALVRITDDKAQARDEWMRTHVQYKQYASDKEREKAEKDAKRRFTVKDKFAAWQGAEDGAKVDLTFARRGVKERG